LIKILGIDHVVIRTERRQEMIDFYTDVLGCAVERDMDAEFGLTQLRAGNALIDIVTVDSVLGEAGGAAPKPTGNNMDHFCLQIEPVAEGALLDHLEAKGVKTSEFQKRYGATGFGRSVYIQDPDQNTVELKGVES